MKKRIFRSIIAVAMTVLIAGFVLAVSFLYGYFRDSQVTQLREELAIAALNVNRYGEEYFDGFDSSVFRFTLVAGDGTVLYDTQASAENMENHLDREEIKEAAESGRGSSERYSSTLTERTFYEAVRLENGDILRISASQATVGALIIGMLPGIAAVILAAGAVALILSERMAKKIVSPINGLDLENPEKNDVYEELAPLLTKISRQHRQISRQMAELKRKKDEFDQITQSMSEGMVMLDKRGFVLSINAAAMKLFEVSGSPEGRDFLTVDRSPEMSRAVREAMERKRSEFRGERNGREYQFIISRIDADGEMAGVVILCIDVTETAFAERNRREFTANVSHELKTPLQSIIGSAELLEAGLVKPEDTRRFIGNIRNEAARLVSLINDIIRLSQLDENSGPVPSPETVDLYGLANEVAAELADRAAERDVKVTVSGGPCMMSGVRGYLYEIVYNLCDNAIRYNKAGGSVEINTGFKNGSPVLTVSDTGIGIPPEHQSRVFERFYRVDKSHSKETGGTGLGLSIVKHAVAYHGGTIKLDSEVNKGTAVTVTF